MIRRPAIRIYPDQDGKRGYVSRYDSYRELTLARSRRVAIRPAHATGGFSASLQMWRTIPPLCVAAAEVIGDALENEVVQWPFAPPANCIRQYIRDDPPSIATDDDDVAFARWLRACNP